MLQTGGALRLVQRLPSFVSAPPALRGHIPSGLRSFRQICTAKAANAAGAENVGVVTALFRKASRAGNGAGDYAVLLVKRGKQPNAGLWALPGGGLRAGESLVAGAMRELEEETGICGSDASLLPKPVDTVTVKVKGRPAWKLYVFAGLQVGLREPAAMDDAADAAFCATGDVARLPTVDGLEGTVVKAMQAVEDSACS